MQALKNAETRLVANINAAADLIDSLATVAVEEALGRIEASASACKARLDGALAALRTLTAGVLAHVEDAVSAAEALTSPMTHAEAPSPVEAPKPAEAPRSSQETPAPVRAESLFPEVETPLASPQEAPRCDEGEVIDLGTQPPALAASKRRGRPRKLHTVNGQH